MILLRPYQIHAIEAVKRASREQKSGYIWHTTGSGKTLTSYKVARNLLQIPSIQKTIFIVDRVDLDQQTTASFTSYAENDVIEIDETNNVNDLIKKLLSDERRVIVTTIQKLNHVMKRISNMTSKKYEQMTQLKVAFVIDECHRAVSPAKKREIEEFLFIHCGMALLERQFLLKMQKSYGKFTSNHRTTIWEKIARIYSKRGYP